MTYLTNNLNSRVSLGYAPTSFASVPTSLTLRFGKRELFICRDFRKRYYHVNPLVECGAGVEAGYLEILLFRRWLLILSKAR